MTLQIELPILNKTTRFNCTSCIDSCCYKLVPVMQEDAKRLAKLGNIFDYVYFRPETDGKIVSGEKIYGVLTLKHKPESEGVPTSCIFFTKDRKCSAYNYRPITCRLFPFNPIFQEHESNYDLEIQVQENQCEGIGQGNNVDMNNILRLSKQWRKERLRYDKLVDKWNENPQDLTKFIRWLMI